MAPSPRKGAAAGRPTDTAAAALHWSPGDATAFAPSILARPKVHRAWERQPKSPFARKSRYRKVWRRYDLRSTSRNRHATEETAGGLSAHLADHVDECDETIANASPSKRIVKKLRTGASAAMAKSTRIKGHAGFEGTRWDRRKSGLPRKLPIQQVQDPFAHPTEEVDEQPQPTLATSPRMDESTSDITTMPLGDAQDLATAVLAEGAGVFPPRSLAALDDDDPFKSTNIEEAFVDSTDNVDDAKLQSYALGGAALIDSSGDCSPIEASAAETESSEAAIGLDNTHANMGAEVSKVQRSPTISVKVDAWVRPSVDTPSRTSTPKSPSLSPRDLSPVSLAGLFSPPSKIGSPQKPAAKSPEAILDTVQITPLKKPPEAILDAIQTTPSKSPSAQADNIQESPASAESTQVVPLQEAELGNCLQEQRQHQSSIPVAGKLTKEQADTEKDDKVQETKDATKEFSSTIDANAVLEAAPTLEAVSEELAPQASTNLVSEDKEDTAHLDSAATESSNYVPKEGGESPLIDFGDTVTDAIIVTETGHPGAAEDATGRVIADETTQQNQETPLRALDAELSKDGVIDARVGDSGESAREEEGDASEDAAGRQPEGSEIGDVADVNEEGQKSAEVDNAACSPETPAAVEDDIAASLTLPIASQPPQLPAREETSTHLEADTAILKDFLSRAAASKANKSETIARRASFSHRRDSDAIRQALASPPKGGDNKDPASPSNDKVAGVPASREDLPLAKLLEAAAEDDTTGDITATLLLQPSVGASSETTVAELDDQQQQPAAHFPQQHDQEQSHQQKPSSSSERQPTRRSSRSRTPRIPGAPPSSSSSTPRNISIRSRHDGADLVLKKKEADELSSLTRMNTRRNKGASVPAGVRLSKLAVERMNSVDSDGDGDAAATAAAAAAAVVNSAGNRGSKSGGANKVVAVAAAAAAATTEGAKSVRWDRRLVYFHDGKMKAAPLAPGLAARQRNEDGTLPSALTPVKPSSESHKAGSEAGDTETYLDGGEAPAPVESSKRSSGKHHSSRMRRLKGLGAANGTPAKGLSNNAPLLPADVEKAEDREKDREKDRDREDRKHRHHHHYHYEYYEHSSKHHSSSSSKKRQLPTPRKLKFNPAPVAVGGGTMAGGHGGPAAAGHAGSAGPNFVPEGKENGHRLASPKKVKLSGGPTPASSGLASNMAPAGRTRSERLVRLRND
ncbi:hypothetical protein BDY21DRAFT_369426 [Lineolata rhizophorae]|uniref:Uncharacterized protein n=1 Tax=Lineolata rhizophorae TaxID=578093 RepID=A0A6A6P956_9PEZI|nr:hypothetical protein BDY21DRAFT_369426 [Lineolata rhizophorae]